MFSFVIGVTAAILFVWVVIPYLMFTELVLYLLILVFVGSLFAPREVGSTYCVFLTSYITCILFLEISARRRLAVDRSAGDWEDRCLRKHSLFLECPLLSRIHSYILNQLRWAGLIFYFCFLWNREWLFALIMLFYFVTMDGIAIRLDPLFFYNDDLRKDNPEFVREFRFLAKEVGHPLESHPDMTVVSDETQFP